MRSLVFYRRTLLLALFIAGLLGLGSKVYHGPLAEWVRDYLGDIVYETFWIALVCLLFPHLKSGAVALAVFWVTATLEALQLWHPPFLEWARSFVWGKLLLGTTFSWWDFPHYAVGCGLTWLGLHMVRQQRR